MKRVPGLVLAISLGSIIDPDLPYNGILSLNGSFQSSNVSIQHFKKLKNPCLFATFLTYNINSSNANSFIFLSLFNDFEEFPDILMLTETWFIDHNTEDIDGFHAHHTCRLAGDCSIYVKEFWNSAPIDVFCISNETLKIYTLSYIWHILNWIKTISF